MNSRTTPRMLRAVVVLAAFTVSLAVCGQTQTLTTLAVFIGTDGAQPDAPLVQGIDGNFYGVTTEGGADGFGTIFRVTPQGTLTTLHNFHGSDGGYADWLIQATDGNLYGTTLTGPSGLGTVFKITLEGALTTLARFNQANGSLPNGLMQGSDGNFYGTALYGGSLTCNPPTGCGTIFKVTPEGAITKLHSFDDADGNEPYAVPIQGTDGNFYGTTRSGGSRHLGTIYKMTPEGALTTLQNFNGTDGSVAIPGLAQAWDGNFYGTTINGGSTFGYNDGTIYKITPQGTLTTLLNLNNVVFDTNALIQATDGNFYGSAIGDGSVSDGSLFVVTEEGALTVLHTFNGFDGGEPRTALVQGTDGKFYGTTYFGGPTLLAQGSVFSFSVGLGAFVKTLTTSGGIGAKVIILGTDLTGTTSVTFNGVAATFTVVSASEVTATVPSGATSGTVRVATSSGTLDSNVPYQVTP
jgi:uncharacterized repeat protein (TIGR03803 family)